MQDSSHVTPKEPVQSSPPSGDAPTASAGLDDSWKAEYESHVETWRAQSAEAREKADRERQRWEEIRAAEKKTGESVEKPLAGMGWESVVQKPSEQALPASTSPSAPLEQRSTSVNNVNFPFICPAPTLTSDLS